MVVAGYEITKLPKRGLRNDQNNTKSPGYEMAGYQKTTDL